MTDTNEQKAQTRHEQILHDRVSTTLFPKEDEPSPIDEIRFLEGPQDDVNEAAMVAKVDSEFKNAFAIFKEIGPCITFYGSARTKSDDPLYAMGRKTAELVSREGFSIMTGGGPGMMEAANRGANDAGGRSIGCTIELPHEDGANDYVTRRVSFKHFFVRKVVMAKYSYGFVILPGGVGTMDEMFEILTLIQCRKVREFPVVLMGVDYWAKLIDFLSTSMIEYKMADAEDVDLFHMTDDPESVCEYITKIAKHRFELHKGAPEACRLDWEAKKKHA
jgi:hypothetical protein